MLAWHEAQSRPVSITALQHGCHKTWCSSKLFVNTKWYSNKLFICILYASYATSHRSHQDAEHWSSHYTIRFRGSYLATAYAGGYPATSGRVSKNWIRFTFLAAKLIDLVTENILVEFFVVTLWHWIGGSLAQQGSNVASCNVTSGTLKS